MKFPTGCLYTNKKISFRSPVLNYDYNGANCVYNDGIVYHNGVTRSYGRFKLKFLIVYNSIEVGRKNSSSGYFIFFIKVH